jgi:tRNA A37 N6-isopentenylltransferase MiaA
LYQRTDKRVDEMMEMGLVEEMMDFHAEYNTHHSK